MEMPDRRAVTEQVDDLVAHSEGLAVLTTVAAGGRPVSTLVNAGPLAHPVDGEPAVALVGMGGARRIAHLERDPRAVVVFSHHRRWKAVEGRATLLGPDHPHPDVDPSLLPGLLRDIYRAAGGGDHPDWDDYDRAMATERRLAIVISIDRAYGTYRLPGPTDAAATGPAGGTTRAAPRRPAPPSPSGPGRRGA
jgi:PPOX class probable F420-dependent enzyme